MDTTGHRTRQTRTSQRQSRTKTLRKVNKKTGLIWKESRYNPLLAPSLTNHNNIANMVQMRRKRKKTKFQRTMTKVISSLVALVLLLGWYGYSLKEPTGNVELSMKKQLRNLTMQKKKPQLSKDERRKQRLKEREEIRQFRDRQKKKAVKELPDYCEAPSPVTEIVIKGERHTGTNWIQNIISQNIFKKSSSGIVRVFKDSRKMGWKHGKITHIFRKCAFQHTSHKHMSRN